MAITKQIGAVAGLVLLLAPAGAWHNPVHALITRTALEALPGPMQSVMAPEARTLADWYSLYPDAYYGTEGEKRAAMQPYCETASGLPIHNVTWRMHDDVAALEHAIGGMAEALRSGRIPDAAKHAGVLSHFLADSTCPAHAMVPMDSSLTATYPPPAGREPVRLHQIIEVSSPEFTLAGRRPQQAGSTVREAAENLLARCYRTIRENREGLDELVAAAYKGDGPAMDRFRRRSAIAGAELVSDAYYTAFALAGMGK